MDPLDVDEVLRAHICVAYLCALRLDALRWLAVGSLPLWYQAATRKLPDGLAWVFGLGVAMLALLAAVYAGLECRWSRRARGVKATRFMESTGLDLAVGVSLHDDLRAGLLCAWGVLAIAPAAAALGVAVRPELIAALSPVALSVVAARIALEALWRPAFPRRESARRERAWASRFGVR